MFTYNNTHIFTGYLKQYLSSFNLPTCRIYTNEFAEYKDKHGTEDPRVLRSFDTIKTVIEEDDKLGDVFKINHMAVRINYLKNDVPYIYYCAQPKDHYSVASWKNSADVFYSSNKTVRGLTRTLSSYGNQYDTVTHEYLGDYLRFIRDYHNINLMSMYNCFNNKICNNIYHKYTSGSYSSVFNSQDSTYRIYAIPVKLFAKYTIAIDCNQGVEMFCGLYNTALDVTDAGKELIAKTYMKVNKALFNQPFIYDKLTIEQLPVLSDFSSYTVKDKTNQPNIYTHWHIANRENDLKLFIKVPTSCTSSITILEGDFRSFNDCQYYATSIGTGLKKSVNGAIAVFNAAVDDPAAETKKTVWRYNQNHSVLNFDKTVDLNNYEFRPISKLQLLAFNTGESYPFADRLVEYLSGSAITPLDDITDNIKRAQRVMAYNNNYFTIEGLWENKMQNIVYDYIMSSGPVVVEDNELKDKRTGLHRRLGHTTKSNLYDVLGYVDKDAEKWYSCWKNENGVAVVKDNIQNVDIYNGLYDIK